MELAFVYLKGRVFVGSSEPIARKDWFKNILKNSEVVIEVGGLKLKGKAKAVNEANTIMSLVKEFARKYHQREPAQDEVRKALVQPMVEIALDLDAYLRRMAT